MQCRNAHCCSSNGPLAIPTMRCLVSSRYMANTAARTGLMVGLYLRRIMTSIPRYNLLTLLTVLAKPMIRTAARADVRSVGTWHWLMSLSLSLQLPLTPRFELRHLRSQVLWLQQPLPGVDENGQRHLNANHTNAESPIGTNSRDAKF